MFCFVKELLIGFMNQPYQARESDGMATVEFGILNDVVTAVEVSLELFFSSQGKICI